MGLFISVGQLAEQLDALAVFLIRAMGEVQTGNIHPGLNHAGKCFPVLAGRTNGGDNFRLAIHNVSPVKGYSHEPIGLLGMGTALDIIQFFCLVRQLDPEIRVSDRDQQLSALAERFAVQIDHAKFGDHVMDVVAGGSNTRAWF